jgi:uncharacterized protein YwqG
LFFYDTEKQPWGFDPKDRAGWAVILAAEASPLSEPPPAVARVPRHGISLETINTLPSSERPELSTLQLTDDESDSLIDLSSAVYGHEPCHQVGGFPSPIQSDAMELECQLVSNGIYCGDAKGYHSPEAAALRGGASDWRLLLQMDGDDDLDLMWGDAGMLYFWIREADARARRFENVWVVLQCH